MLKIIFVFASLFLNQTFAGPLKPPSFIPLSGDYALSEKMVVTHLKSYVRVDGLTADGAQKIQKLKADGYLCSQKTVLHWVCSKFLAPVVLSDELAILIQDKWKGLLVSFRVPDQKPVLQELDGEMQVWNVPQKVFIRTSLQADPKTWDQVNYVYNSAATLERCLIFLGDYRDAESPMLKLGSNDDLIAQDIIDVTKGEATLRYFVDLSISRIQ